MYPYLIKKQSFMMIMTVLILVFFCWIMPGFSAENMLHTYSLPELYRLADRQAERIKISELNISISETERNKAKSALFPRVDLYTNYQTFDERTYINPESLNNGMNAGYRFTLNGNELTAFRITEQGVGKAGLDHTKVREDYLFQVNQVFYQILLAQQAVIIADSNINRLSENKKSVEKRLDLEDVTVTALYRSEAELSNAMAAKTRTENTVKLAKANLREMVNLPPEFDIEIPKGIIKDKKPELNKLTIYEEALKKRLDVKSLLIAGEITESTVKWYQGDFWPAVSLQAAYNHTSAEPESPGYDYETLAFRAGINMNLFDGGLKRANLREAYDTKSQTDLLLKDLKEKIYLEIEQVCLDISSQYDVIESLKDQLIYSQANHNAVTSLFAQGLANIIDVIDANSLLVTSETQLLEARYRYVIAMEKLKKARGDFLKYQG